MSGCIAARTCASPAAFWAATACWAAGLSGGPAASWAAAAAPFAWASVTICWSWATSVRYSCGGAGELAERGRGLGRQRQVGGRLDVRGEGLPGDGALLLRRRRVSGGSASMFARAMWVCSSHQSTCSLRSASTGTVPSA